MSPSSGYNPDLQEAEALSRRYLQAGRREWEAHRWGSVSLFAELALEWAARATRAGSHSQ